MRLPVRMMLERQFPTKRRNCIWFEFFTLSWFASNSSSSSSSSSSKIWWQMASWISPEVHEIWWLMAMVLTSGLSPSTPLSATAILKYEMLMTFWTSSISALIYCPFIFLWQRQLLTGIAKMMTLLIISHLCQRLKRYEWWSNFKGFCSQNRGKCSRVLFCTNGLCLSRVTAVCGKAGCIISSSFVSQPWPETGDGGNHVLVAYCFTFGEFHQTIYTYFISKLFKQLLSKFLIPNGWVFLGGISTNKRCIRRSADTQGMRDASGENSALKLV